MGIQPQGETLRKAVKWIGQQRTDRPDEKVTTLVEEACVKFDLPPKDQEFLLRLMLKE